MTVGGPAFVSACTSILRAQLSDHPRCHHHSHYASTAGGALMPLHHPRCPSCPMGLVRSSRQPAAPAAAAGAAIAPALHICVHHPLNCLDPSARWKEIATS